MKIASYTFRQLAALVASFTAAALLAGCSPNVSESAAQSNPELEKLRAENEQVQQLRRENQELARLRKDNEEVHRLRGELAELPKLRQEQEQLRAQINQSSRSAANAAASSATALAAQGGPVPQGSVAAAGAAESEIESDPNAPQEGDEILIEPKLLGKLLPGFDWEKLERKEPIAVRALLEQQGIVLTNYQQLIDYGITNYVIQRKPPEEAAEPGAVNQP